MNSSSRADLLESDKLEEQAHTHTHTDTFTGPSRVVEELPPFLQIPGGKS